MKRAHALSSRLVVCLVVGCAMVGGCSEYIDPYVPEPIRPFVEPEFASRYLLYRPSSYDRTKSWPLVVACPGPAPDSPNRQIRAWTQPAESYGFLVVVPALESNQRHWRTPEPEDQLRLIRADERHILAAIRHVRAGHNISSDRIFIHGWSTGAHAALHTGLRHPEIFRAVALSFPAFNEAYMVEAQETGDSDQPILLYCSLTDAFADSEAKRCGDWLKTRSAKLTVDMHASSSALNAERSVTFFEEVVRSHPWIRIRAFPAAGDNPLSVQFKLHCSCRLTAHQWEFSDGGSSTAAQPFHTFSTAGTYRVSVTVEEPIGKRHHRSIILKVPEGVIASQRPENQTE